MPIPLQTKLYVTMKKKKNKTTKKQAKSVAKTSLKKITTGQPVPLRTTESADPVVLPLPIDQLPPVIREAVSVAPDNRKIACMVACLSPLCALATRVRLKYCYDSRPSALLMQVLVEAPQSTGKQFASDIERMIMNPTLKARDEQQRRFEQECREAKRSRKANEKIGPEPLTTIRVIPPTISKTVLLRRADFYERALGDVLTFWMFSDELAQVTDSGRQSYSNLRTIMRSAYDLGAEFGMDFASENSYSAIADINICSMFCCTPSALDDYMDRRAIEGGNVTRVVLCRLEDEMGADGAIFKPYSPEQEAVIAKTLQRMMDDTYADDGALKPQIMLETGWIDDEVRQWCVSKGREAVACCSMALDVFRKRSSASAFRAASLCYYLYQLEGIAEEEARERCRQIYRFMAEYILCGLMERWGERFEELEVHRTQPVERGKCRSELYEGMDELFCVDDLLKRMTELGYRSPVRVILSKWKACRLVERTDDKHYRKIGL